MNADRFVDECRREWKRLGVRDELADEMAAELSADLADAAADGVPAEELLGACAFDACGFAAAWASERGVVPVRRKRRVGALASAALVVAAIAVLAGLLATRSTAPTRAHTPSARHVVVVNPVTGQVVRELVLRLTQAGQPTG